MKKTLRVLSASAAMVFALITVASLRAQDVQQTTTTRESTTTTSGMTPPPGAQMPEPMPGFAEFGYTADNYAAHRGYNDGYNKGISDHDTGHSYRPTSDHYYNHPIGYQGGPVSHGEYDRIYKEAFLHGYERGYRRVVK